MTGNDLHHFRSAQDTVLEQVSSELAAGRKRTHWMWFVFPQLAGLGRFSTAARYAITDLDHARRYLDDPVLGDRLWQNVRLILRHENKTAVDIVGTPDDLKLHSCLTLFGVASSAPADKLLFDESIRVFYGGHPYPQTMTLLAGHELVSTPKCRAQERIICVRLFEDLYLPGTGCPRSRCIDYPS